MSKEPNLASRWLSPALIALFAGVAPVRAQHQILTWGFCIGNGELTGRRYTGAAATDQGTIALRGDGTVATWGLPGGEVPDPPAGTTCLQVAGSFHYLALRSDG